MRISQDKIEEVREANPILEIVQGYVALKKRGQNWFGLCPFHSENSPSFSVNPARGIFRCFGCGRGGNVYGFVMEQERVTFVEAVRMLADRAHIELPKAYGSSDDEESEAELLSRSNGLAREFFHRQLVQSNSEGAEQARNYLQSRGYGKDVIERFLLGYAPDSWHDFDEYARANNMSIPLLLQAGLLKENKEKRQIYDAFRHRIMFPIRNLAGRVIAFGGRKLREDDESAKYVNSPESAIYHKGRELFGLWEARDVIRKNDEAILVEGYTDCLSLVMAGVNEAVASLGTSLTENQARLLKRFTGNVVVLYDGDNAGLAAARRAIDVLMGVGIAPQVIVLPENEDPDSFVRKQGGEAVWQLRNEAMSPVEFQLHVARKSKTTRSAAVQELVASAALIVSPVEQDAFLQEIAAKSQISLDALRRELARVRAPQRETEMMPARENWPPPGPLSVLARVLVKRPDLRTVAFDLWTPDGINDPRFAALFKSLFEEWKTGEMREPETLLDEFTESPLREFLAECLDEEEDDSDEAHQFAIDKQTTLDCLRMMRADEIKAQIGTLKRQLAENPNDGKLLDELQTLMRKEKDVRTGK